MRGIRSKRAIIRYAVEFTMHMVIFIRCEIFVNSIAYGDLQVQISAHSPWLAADYYAFQALQ